MSLLVALLVALLMFRKSTLLLVGFPECVVFLEELKINSCFSAIIVIYFVTVIQELCTKNSR